MKYTHLYRILGLSLSLAAGTGVADELASEPKFIEPEEGMVRVSEWLPVEPEATEVEDFNGKKISSIIGGVEGKMLADPATSTTYPCYYIRNYNWSYPGDGLPVVSGKIRFPSNTCNSQSGPPFNRPVLIFMHGNAQDNNDHNYLMAHLARNGFVTASISNSGDNENRARQAISYLNSLHTYWGFANRLSNKVAFAGHSRGGEGAVTAARLAEEQPGLTAENYDVQAVISIAPTDGGGSNGNDPRETLDGLMTDGFLGIYGSADTDVSGGEANLVNTQPQKTVFAIYDRAGSEFSTEGFQIVGSHVEKAMVYLYNVGHRAFLKKSNGGAIGSGTTVGNNAAKAYFNAFLRWQFWNQTSYKDYFNGVLTPPSLQAQELYNQFSADQRRVVDNFENNNLAQNTMGGSVIKSSQGIVTFLEDDLHQLLKSSPHETGGIRVTWSNGGTITPYIRWWIPAGNIPFAGSRRDVSGFDGISLRVGQVYNQAFNTPGQDQSFRIRLLSNNGLSSKVSIADYLPIPEQDEFICPPFACGNNVVADFSKSAMSTVRIPLSAFNNVDLGSVRAVYAYFDDPGYNSGAVSIDNLEFVVD